MSKAHNIQSYFIPALLGGLNIRDPITELQPNEAYTLQNYYPFTNMLRAIGQENKMVTLSSVTSIGNFHNWITDTAGPAELVVITTDARIYQLDQFFVAANITGAMTWTVARSSSVPFGGYLFLCNGTNQVVRVDAVGVTSAAAFVGPGGVDTSLYPVWSYKGRLYFIEKDTNNYWYGGLEFVTGALTKISLSSIISDHGRLLFGVNWTNNGGIGNEEFNVFVTTMGEVLVYSGDYPGAPNWDLVGKTRIPKPFTTGTGPPFKKIGGDVLIYTQTGVIRLSDALASVATPAAIYTITDKLSKYFQALYSSTAQMALHDKFPFLYISGTSATETLILNYQSGAWSKLRTAQNATAIGFGHGYLMYGNGADVYFIGYSNSGRSGNSRQISTGATNLGTPERKMIKSIRWILGSSDVASGSTEIKYLCGATDPLIDAAGGSVSGTDIVTGTCAAGSLITMEFRPGVVGTQFTFTLIPQTTSAGDTGPIDEIYGCEVEFETGGVY